MSMERLKTSVAVKVLHPDLGAALGGERFLSEIRTTARQVTGNHFRVIPNWVQQMKRAVDGAKP
jgi:hypothetical protein